MFRHRVFIKRRKRNGTKYLLKCTRTCNTTTPPSTWKTTRTTTMLIRLQPVRRKQSVTQPLYPGHTKTTTTTPTTVHTIERWWSDHRPSILGAADCFYLLLKNTTQPAPLFLKTDRRLVFFPLFIKIIPSWSQFSQQSYHQNVIVELLKRNSIGSKKSRDPPS